MSTPNGSAGLEALGGMTAEVDKDNPDPAKTAAQKAASDQAQATADAAMAGAKAWGMLMFTVGGFAQMIAPELRSIYSEERCLDWGQNAYAVAKKYGWDKPELLPELALAGSTIGFALPTVFLVRERIKAAREGGGPVGWVEKLGLWWRTRKARKMATAAVDPSRTAPAVKPAQPAAGAAHGGQQ